jgi:hypothetical protein
MKTDEERELPDTNKQYQAMKVESTKQLIKETRQIIEISRQKNMLKPDTETS